MSDGKGRIATTDMTEHSPMNSPIGFLETPQFRGLRRKRQQRNLRQSMFFKEKPASRRRATSLSLYGDDATSRENDGSGDAAHKAAELRSPNVEDEKNRTLNVEIEMPSWGQVPLWGEIVHKPKLRHATHNHYQAPRQRHNDGTVPRYPQGTERSLGVLRIKLGLVHLCTVDLEHSEQHNSNGRVCREYFHYDGINVFEDKKGTDRSRTFILTVEFEDQKYEKIRMARDDMLAWDKTLEFQVKNFRSKVIVTVYGYRSEWLDDPTFDEAGYVGQASFSVLSQIECQNNATMELNEVFCEHPVRDFHNFYYERPKATLFDESNDKEHAKCEKWYNDLLWYDLTAGDKGPLVGRIGIDAYFEEEHYMQCFSYEQGSWDKHSQGYTYKGKGVPGRIPDSSPVENHTLAGTIEALAKLWNLFGRIRAFFQYIATFLNRTASILTWEHFNTSLRWCIGSTIWAYFFRLQHAAVHVSVVVLWGLFANYMERQRGIFYIQKLSPDPINRNRVQLKCAKLLIGVLDASTSDAAYNKLSIHVQYTPGQSQDNKKYNVGKVEETDHIANKIQHKVNQAKHHARDKAEWLLGAKDLDLDEYVHEFSCPGRQYNLLTRLKEYFLCQTLAPGDVMENRTILWKPDEKEFASGDKPGDAEIGTDDEDTIQRTPEKMKEGWEGDYHRLDRNKIDAANGDTTPGHRRRIFVHSDENFKSDDGDYIPPAPKQAYPQPPPENRMMKKRDKETVESLEYKLLQSSKFARMKYNALPWREHEGVLIFEIFSQRGLLNRNDSIGVVEVPVKDLVDGKREGGKYPTGAQKIRLERYDIKKKIDSGGGRKKDGDEKIGQLKLQLQLWLPEDHETFREIDRLRQYELEDVMRPNEGSIFQKYKNFVYQGTDQGYQNLYATTDWIAQIGDDIYAVSALLRWVHPWKTALLVAANISLVIILFAVPFHRLLLCLVVAAFSDGFVHRYKYRVLNWYNAEFLTWFRQTFGERSNAEGELVPVKKPEPLFPPEPVQVKIFGMTLNCSSKSSLHRVRNLLNSMPNDRDLDEYYSRKRDAVMARNKYMEVSYSGIRYGGLWAGPLQYKMKVQMKDLRGLANDAQALVEREYKERFVVISMGYLRLYKNRGDQAQHHAAEGYDDLVTCGGLVKVRGPNIDAKVNIQNAVIWKVADSKGGPKVELDENPNQPDSRLFSFRCVDEQVAKIVVNALKQAGCEIKSNPRKRRSTSERRGSGAKAISRFRASFSAAVPLG